MPELYLRLLDRVLTPVLLMLAVILFLGGHNHPGGGFIAGLIVAAAFQLQILSRGEAFVRHAIGKHLSTLMGAGLTIALLSALFGFVQGGFFKGVWGKIALGAVAIDLGTPFFFDLGVFLVVLSVVTSYILGLNEQSGDEQR